MKNRNIQIPEKGKKPEDLVGYIKGLKQSDALWDSGKMYGFVYYPDPPVAEVLKEVSQLYFFENALNTLLFKSVVMLENQTVEMVSNLLHGDGKAVGNITSGGTESIFLALKAARERSRRLLPDIQVPEVILPVSVHPAFHKVARCLGIKTVSLPLDEDYRADISLLPDMISANTILIVGSAPSYPHGVMDPIEEMGRCAMERNILFHVDACLGGFMLPFAGKLGYAVPPFDFRVDGVTSVSADIHKYGYGMKGSSIILYRNRELRRDQFFAHSHWPGGMFGSPTLIGTHSGGPVAAAWAILNLLGMEGYLEMARKTMEHTTKLKNGICAIDGLSIVGDPVMSVFSFTSGKNDIYLIADGLESRGWSFDRIAQPEAIHLIVTLPNLPRTDEFLADLRSVLTDVRKNKLKKAASSLSRKVVDKMFDLFPGKAPSVLGAMAARNLLRSTPGNGNGTSAFYGIAASREGKSDIDEMILDFLDKTYS